MFRQFPQFKLIFQNLFGLAGIVLGIVSRRCAGALSIVRLLTTVQGKLYYMMSHLNFPFELMPHAQFEQEFPFWAIWSMEGKCHVIDQCR